MATHTETMTLADASALDSWRGPLLALAGCATVAATLPEQGLHPFFAIALCMLWAVPASTNSSPWALAPLIPLATLLGGGWSMLLAWSLVALSAPLALLYMRQRHEGPDLRRLRHELRDYEREVDILERHLARYPTLLEACQQLAATREVDQLATILCDASRDLVRHARSVAVYVRSSRGLSCRASFTADADAGASLDQLIDTITYVVEESRSYVHRKNNKVIAILPLRIDREGPDDDMRRGALTLVFRTRGLEDHLVIEAIEALARLGGLGMAAMDLMAEARSLALRDELTGLYGQHEFRRRLEEQMSVVRRQGDSLGVILCDMDHLKKFNDRFGHAVGDEALRQVAKVIADCCPEEALACRYGGEEFAILVPFTRGGKVQRIAEAIHSGIRRIHLPNTPSDTSLTASLGWALLKDETDGTDVIRRADAACYRAKATGRDRVCAAEEVA